MNRKYFMMAFVSLFTVVALCSCDKDEDEKKKDDPVVTDSTVVAGYTVTVTVENGNCFNSKIGIVKAYIDVDNADDVEVANAPYSNGGFTLKLQSTISEAYLYAWFEDEDDYLEGVTVSNPNVKIADMDDIDAYKSNDHVGYFYNELSDGWEMWYVYANENLSMTGNGEREEEENYDSNQDGDYDDEGDNQYIYTWKYKYNMHLRKGWNAIYYKETESDDVRGEEITTQAPASKIKWYFEEYSSSSESSVSPKIPSLITKLKARR
jgi:hypothetical protein